MASVYILTGYELRRFHLLTVSLPVSRPVTSLPPPQAYTSTPDTPPTVSAPSARDLRAAKRTAQAPYSDITLELIRLAAHNTQPLSNSPITHIMESIKIAKIAKLDKSNYAPWLISIKACAASINARTHANSDP